MLRRLYPLKPISAQLRIERTEEIHGKLVAWRSDLASFLETEDFNAGMFLPIVQRQRNVLNLTYWHAIILTHRPFLLNKFTAARQSRQARRDVNDDSCNDELQTRKSVEQCLVSAMYTVKIIDQMTQIRQMSRAFWVCICLVHVLERSLKRLFLNSIWDHCLPGTRDSSKAS